MSTLSNPVGIAEARTVAEGVDRALLSGLARLNDGSREALGALAATCEGGPLGAMVAEAVAALGRGELLAQHLGAIAAGRAALEGAIADALLVEMAGFAGVIVDPPQLEAAPTPDVKTRVLMESARQWLVEIALGGFGQLEAASIAPAVASLRALQEHPPLVRLAALLTGFADELIDAAPTSGRDELPQQRWADLWSTAMLATFGLPDVAKRSTVAGVLSPLGVDVRHHDRLVSLVVHALFEQPDEAPRLLRINLSAWKVDAISGAEVLALVAPLAPDLVTALVTPTKLRIEGATLLGTGDLLWDGTIAASRESFSPHAVALAGAHLHAPPPRDRHRMQLAVPITGTGDPPGGLAFDYARLSPLVELDDADRKGVIGFVGLLRYDDGFTVQPLAFATKKAMRGAAESLAAAAKLQGKDTAIAVLTERASRLLRQS